MAGEVKQMTEHMRVSSRDSFINHFEEICLKNANRSFISYFLNDGRSEVISFSEFHTKSKKNVEVLYSYGLKAGDRVAILSELSPYCFLSFLTLTYADMTAVVIDAGLPEQELTRLLLSADVRGIIASKNAYDTYAKTYRDERPVMDIQHDLNLFYDRQSEFDLEMTKDPDLENAVILFSSGTTSQAKGVMIGYQGLLNGVETYDKVDLNIEKKKVKYFHIFPYYHISGFQMFLNVLFKEGEIGMIEAASAVKLQAAFLEYKPNYFGMIPKVYDTFKEKIEEVFENSLHTKQLFFLLHLCEFIRKNMRVNIGRILFKSVNTRLFGGNMIVLGVGGGITREETSRFFYALGYEWINVYASTEANFFASTSHKDKYPIGTVGNIYVQPKVEIKIDCPDKNGQGEILVKNEMLFRGYFREPELTKKSMIDGFFRMGDLGYIDKKGYLYTVGRCKDSIHLQNGEKISPEDVENLYASIFPKDVKYCFCGIQRGQEYYDRIHVFIEKGDMKIEDMELLKTNLCKQSLEVSVNYKIADVHMIDTLPISSVGKVKRYLLKDYIKRDFVQTEKTESVAPTDRNIKSDLISIIKRIYQGNQEVDVGLQLESDLGFDSLNLFELCVAIENQFGIAMENCIRSTMTVGEVISILENENQNDTVSNLDYDINSFPLEKTRFSLWMLKVIMAISRMLWKFEVEGLENIPKSGNYILCPNHQTHLDGLWTFSFLPKKELEKIKCLAKQEHLETKVTRFFLRMLGGIPVDRSGNPAPAMKRCLECLREEKSIVLIHPEGTRTKTGKMGIFKAGAAALAIDSGKKIIPVSISGGTEVYPPQNKLPHVFGRKGRYRIKISFGQAIEPENLTPDEMIALIENSIRKMNTVEKKKYVDRACEGIDGNQNESRAAKVYR